MADRKHGVVDLADCIEEKNSQASNGYIDEKKIGIIFGNYGGYLVLGALAFKPYSFDVGLDIFDISNWKDTFINLYAKNEETA